MAKLAFFSVVIYAICLSLLLSTTYASGGNDTDREALLQIKAKISADPLRVLNSWNDSLHFCKWYGVTCGRKHQRVIELNLGSLKLGGQISPYTGNLSFLKVFNFENNSFTESIPPEIDRLRRLQVLRLDNNSLGGEIPSNLSHCSNLFALWLGSNNLIGKILAEISFLSKLQLLDLDDNNLTESIPANFGNLSNLLGVSLGENNLVGTIPDSLGQLQNLRFLSLGLNQLFGVVPISVFNISSMRLLDLSGNHLEGHFPRDLFTSLPKLSVFSVFSNQFSGCIPPSLSNASNLEFLEVRYNNLTGIVPNMERSNKLRELNIGDNYLSNGGLLDELEFLCSLTNSTALKVLSISVNHFRGVLPECITNLSSTLKQLFIGYNHITGSIPFGIRNLVNLEILHTGNNDLSGIIPQTIGDLQKLNSLDLSENELIGEVPSSLGNLTELLDLYLQGNNLGGSIPKSLGDCRQLLFLELSQNNLNGTLPPQVIPGSSVLLDLSFNHLTGSIPIGIQNMANLGTLDVSNNKFSGEIPAGIGSCTSLEYLFMQHNLLQGSIPSSFSSLRGLRQLDLSHNNLSGKIPEFFSSFNISVLNLSFNQFVGMVPTEGIFGNANVTSVVGNIKLCGGIPKFKLPVCDVQKSKHKQISLKLKVIVAFASGLVVLVLLLLLVSLLIFRKKKEKVESPSLANSVLRLSFWDLQEATNGFSVGNLVGVGSFGSVYKGILSQSRLLVAVKVMNLQHHGAIKSFMAECEALRNIRHRNLVKVLTACSSIDYQGNDFKALVYEYMVNGSLDEWLHRPLQVDEFNQPRKSLALGQRLHIIIDIAFALEYLHFQCEAPIIHCDLKPSNILLDDEMVAHVGDFGLAKLIFKDIHNCPTNESNSIGIRGTIGYAPPEYGLGSEVTTNGDVYSYGIMLLEIFTGKSPTDETFKGDWTLHKLATQSLSDGVAKIIDPMLLEELGVSETSTNTIQYSYRMRNNMGLKCLTSVIEIGVACSAKLQGERMNIAEVASRLCSIRDKFIGHDRNFR